jgi:hypothetical protein
LKESLNWKQNKNATKTDNGKLFVRVLARLLATSRNLQKSLEPLNLDDFLTSYKDGDKFWLKYKIAEGQASILHSGRHNHNYRTKTAEQIA